MSCFVADKGKGENKDGALPTAFETKLNIRKDFWIRFAFVTYLSFRVFAQKFTAKL